VIREVEVNGGRFLISYDIVNNKKDKWALFLHGWGSKKEDLKLVFFDIKCYNLLFLDIPGFGKSSLPFSLDSFLIKEVIEVFLKEVKIKPDLIVAHSFGGKIAVLLNPKKLILLSSAGILKKKSLFVKSKIFLAKLFNKIGLSNRFFRSKDVKGVNEVLYETFKKVVDEDFSDIFANFNGKATIFWGKKDKATPLSSGKRIASLIKNSKFIPLDGDHFFFYKNSALIKEEICNI